jgi:glycosyltransferase involved in cell wall biosynthesis
MRIGDAQMALRRTTPAVWHLIDSRSVGGAERHIASIIQSLTERGVRAEAVLYRDYGNNPWLAQLRDARVPVRVLPGSFRGLVTELAQERPAILHTHGYKAGILGRAGALLCRVSVVTTFHSGERSRGKLYAYEWLDEWTSILGQRVAVSRAVQNRLPLSSALIGNFVRTAAQREIAALPRSVAFVGRLSREKRPDLFCQLAESSGAGLEWDVYGDGPLRAELERRYSGLVRFHGVVADMQFVWPTVGLLVMPSSFEGLPVAALEALSAGVPILASRVGGLPDVVIEDKTGWLFEPGDLAASRQLLERWRLLEAAAQRRIRAACRAHAESQFGEADKIDRLLAIYHRAGLTSGDADFRASVQKLPAN